MGYRLRLSRLACAAAGAALFCAAPAQADNAFQRGFTIMGWTAGSYSTARSDRIVNRVAGDGSSHVAIFTRWLMDSATSSTIAPDAGQTPSDAGIVHAVETARQAGMAAVLKPQIGIRTGAWIGDAHPVDLDAFWASYRTMLLHYAGLAQEAGASVLVIGTEMRTLSSDDARWRALIADVRRRFGGQLTYAANYDEFERVPFWDALDYIGIDAYFPLADADDPTPSVDALAAAWTKRGYVDRIAAVARRAGKKVLFTEIGYRGIHSTAVQPNRWDLVDAADGQAQGNAYEAFYRAVAGQPWLAGVYWWGADVDKWWIKDYSPLGKPAEQIMSAWNAAAATPSPAPPQAPPTHPQPSEPAGTVTTVPEEILQTIAQVQPAPVVGPPPAVASPPPAVGAPSSTRAVRSRTVTVALRKRRINGAVTPFSRACGGLVQLQARASAVAERAARPNAAGKFSIRLPRNRARMRVLYTSRCGRAVSRWITPPA